ncbi:MAG: MFS transporter [Pseudonocardiaceae bacterium]
MARAKAAREALPPAPSAGTLSQVLANVEFRALWATEALSVAGDQLAKVALAIMVYTRTQSAFWAALVYAMTFLPALAGGLGLSQLADRCPRRTLLVSGALIQATFVGLMALPGMPLAVLCGLVFAVQLVAAPANAAQQAITRETFDSDMLYLRSQDLRGITTNTMMLVGLGGGGLLVTLIGTSWALVADATTFVVAAAILRRWVRQRTSAGGAADRWFDGVRHVFGDRRLRVLLALSWLVGLAVVPEGLAAPIADELGAPDQSVGWLLAADPLGFLIGAFLLSRYACPATRQRLVFGLSMCSVQGLGKVVSQQVSSSLTGRSGSQA